MAKTLALLCKNRQSLLGFTNSTIRSSEIFFIKSNGIRNLFSPGTLGIDSYNQQRERTKSQFVNISSRFKEKMLEYTSDESKNMVFTDDLKNMLHLAESDSDVKLLIKMLKRFNQQNKQLRFGNFIFGPVIMRTFYYLNKPEEAFLCFKDEDLDGLFDQIVSYQILMDILFENQKFDEIIETFELVKKKQVDGVNYGRNVIVLVFAACYKLNTPESFKYTVKLWKELQSSGHLPMRRAITFCAALAINQDAPAVALEMLSISRNTNYTTVRNLKVSALIDAGRVEEAVYILKSIITEDNASTEPLATFDRDVVDKVKQAIEKLGNSDVTLEFNRVYKYFEKQGHIADMTLDSHLCQEIVGPSIIGGPRITEGYARRSQVNQWNDGNRTRFPQRIVGGGRFTRPGLADLQ